LVSIYHAANSTPVDGRRHAIQFPNKIETPFQEPVFRCPPNL